MPLSQAQTKVRKISGVIIVSEFRGIVSEFRAKVSLYPTRDETRCHQWNGITQRRPSTNCSIRQITVSQISIVMVPSTNAWLLLGMNEVISPVTAG